MTCDCNQYSPITLDRKSITRRIKESKAIRTKLTLLSELKDLRLALFKCQDCGQFWQSGHDWNFGDKEYLFQVPEIEIPDWNREPYAQPAALMVYSAAMRDFCTRACFDPTDKNCRAENCPERAIPFSVFCRKHHIESLQQLGRLPPKPAGRLFPPYYVETKG
jgi:hypothetical protein